MKQKLSKIKVALLSLLALIVCATVFSFIGIKFGSKLSASAAFKIDPETGYTVIQDDDGLEGYFNITVSGDKRTLTGFSEKTYKLLGVSPYKPGSIPEKDPLTGKGYNLKVIIPEGVTHVGTYAFDSCKALKDIVFPDSLTTLGSLVFEFTGITELNITKNLTDLGDYRFLTLDKITVAEGNEKYTTDAGQGADKDGTCILNAVVSNQDDGSKTITAGTTLILGTSRTVIPETVTDIKANAFTNVNLTSIKIPSSVTTIADAVFNDSSLTEVDLSENSNYVEVGTGCIVKATAQNALLFTYGEKVVVPDSITKIGGDSLSSASMKEVTIPNTITFGEYDMRPRYLEKITLSGENRKYSLDEYGNLIETGTNGQKSLRIGVLIHENGKAVGKVGNDVVKIEGRAYAFRRIESITIPENVTALGASVFWDSTVKEIEVHPYLTSIGDTVTLGTPYSFDEKNYDNGNVFYLGKCLLEVSQPIVGEYAPREDTVAIADGAFYRTDQPNLTKIKLPEGLVYVGDAAFGGCSALTTVYVPSTLETVVGSSAFPKSTILVVEDKEAYEALTGSELTRADGALQRYKSQVGYEVNVTFKVKGEADIVTKALAGQTFAYQYVEPSEGETMGEWKNLGFSPNGYYVQYWRNDTVGATDNGQTKEISNSTPVPTDAEELIYTAMQDESGSGELEKVEKLYKPTLTQGMELTYGEQYPLPQGYNPKYMQLKYEVEVNGLYKDWVPTNGETAPRNVGNYSITITPVQLSWEDGKNDPVTAAFSIKRLTIEELSWFVDGGNEDLSIMYDGNEHTVYASFEEPYADGYGIHKEYKLTAAGEYVNAGVYEVTVELPAELQGNFYLSENAKDATLIINAQQVTVSWNVADGYQYLADETAHSPTAYIAGNLPNMDELLKENEGYKVFVYKQEEYGSGAPLSSGAIEKGKYVIEVVLTSVGGVGNFEFASYNGKDKFTVYLNFEIVEQLIINVYWENYYEELEYDGFDHTPVAYFVTNLSAERHYLTVSLMFGDDYDQPTDSAFKAGKYKAIVNVLEALSNELRNKLEQTRGKIFGHGDNNVICSFESGSQDGTGEDNVTFVIKQISVTLYWLNDHATFSYDGYAHSPIAYYIVDGLEILLKVTITDSTSSVVLQAIETGKYRATITDPRIENLDVQGVATYKDFEIIRQRSTVSVTWTGTSTFTYNGEPQAPVAVISCEDGEELNAVAVSVYMASDGVLLEGAPVNVGSYKVTTTFYDENEYVLAETSYEFYILRAKVAKPVVGVSVFATMEEAKAYAPAGYDANSMVIGGEEGDGVYVLAIALKSQNYEWIDGTTDAESYTLKISPDLSKVEITPDGGVTNVYNTALSKKTLYVIIGGIAVAALIALIALIASLSRRKVIIRGSDDDEGFYEDYE